MNFARFDAKMGERLAELRADFDKRLAELKAELVKEIADRQSGLIKWMFVFWAPTALAVAGLLLRR